MLAQVERLSKASAIKMTAVTVVHSTSSRGLPSIYTARLPVRALYFTINTTMAIVTAAHTIAVIQNIAVKSASIVPEYVEIPSGSQKCWSNAYKLPTSLGQRVMVARIAGPTSGAKLCGHGVDFGNEKYWAVAGVRPNAAASDPHTFIKLSAH